MSRECISCADKKEGSSFLLPSENELEPISRLERELHAEADDGEIAVVGEVVSAVSENAEVVQAGETGFETATHVDIATLLRVCAVTTTCENVGGDAKGGDGVTEDEATIELMMLAVGGINAITRLDPEIGAEEVFGEHAAAEGIFTTAGRKNSTTESAESEGGLKRIATNGSNGLNSFAGFT